MASDPKLLDTLNFTIRRIGHIPTNRELKGYLANDIIPIKFCYPGEGGDMWDKLRSSKKKYKLGRREYYALARVLSRARLPEPVNVIHIGPGNGIEIPLLADSFDFKRHNYVGVDISRRMIRNTIRNHPGAFARMGSAYFVISDIEAEGNLRKICDYAKAHGHKRNLLLLIGQGVLCSNPKLFSYLASSLGRNDSVLITLERDDSKKRGEILQTYDLSLTRNLLRVGLERAGANKGRFLPASFNEDSHEVEVYFKTARGRKILCLTSYKPSTAGQFKESLLAAGLKPVFVSNFNKTHTIGALCKRGRD